MIRLFVGLELPEDIKEQIFSLRGGLINARWVKKENLHLDLRFIGNVEEPKAEDILSSLGQIRFPAFNLSFKEIGMFSTGGEPRDLWTGVSNFSELVALRNKIETALIHCNIEPERHKFHAHVRIAKLRGTTIPDVQKYIACNNLFKSKEFKVEYFTLFSSHSHQNGEGSFFRAENQYGLSLI